MTAFAAQARRSYSRFAIIDHNDAVAKVTANDPRPLFQAVEALQDEYGWRGWRIDYEDPPYGGRDELIDSTDPAWRAAHPDEKGATVPSGGLFVSIYPEALNEEWSSAEIETALAKVVSDYNESGNPGKFAIQKEAEKRFAVVGTSIKDEAGHDRQVASILDVPISLPRDERTADETLSLITERLSAKTGVKVGYGGFAGMADNCAIQSRVTVGGQNRPARALLMQTVDHTSCVRIWRLLYNTEDRTYILSFRNEVNGYFGRAH